MTILVPLDPQTEAILRAQAERYGVDPAQYLGEFLRELLPLYSSGLGMLSPGDVERMTKVMTAGSENLPVLPLEVNDQDSYYEDHV